jgi:MFS family permease
MMCLLGGFGTLMGPVVGGLIMTVLLEFVRGFAEWKEFLYGFLLLGLLIFMPNGLLGLLRQGWREWMENIGLHLPTGLERLGRVGEKGKAGES